MAELQRAEQVRAHLEAERAEQMRQEIASHMVQPQNGEAPPAEQQPVEIGQQDFEVAIARYPEEAKRRVREHPEYVLVPRMTAKLVAAHFDAIEAGHAEFSPDYFQYLDEKVFEPKAVPPLEERIDENVTEQIVSRRKPPPTRPALATEPREAVQEHEQTPEQRRAAAMTSAPPTKAAPSYSTGRPDSGRVRLSVAEQEIARASGLSDVEYATQKLRLQREKTQDPERFRDR